MSVGVGVDVRVKCQCEGLYTLSASTRIVRLCRGKWCEVRMRGSCTRVWLCKGVGLWMCGNTTVWRAVQMHGCE